MIIKEPKITEGIYSGATLPKGKLALHLPTDPNEPKDMVCIKTWLGLGEMDDSHKFIVNIENGIGSFGADNLFRVLPEGTQLSLVVDNE